MQPAASKPQRSDRYNKRLLHLALYTNHQVLTLRKVEAVFTTYKRRSPADLYNMGLPCCFLPLIVRRIMVLGQHTRARALKRDICIADGA